MKTTMERVLEHRDEALEHFPESRIVGIFLQGSQNYELDLPTSDVDTKLIVVPTLEDIIFNRKPVSTTHIRANDEHIDFKDIRLMFQTFRKQNLNFVEILFSKYAWINPLYAEYWNKLVAENERIARYNPYAAVATMKGIALEKYHALEHEYPSKVDIIREFGYDAKQLHHLLRVEEYLMRYIDGEKYSDCLISKQTDYLKQVKTQGFYSLADAQVIALKSIYHTTEMAEDYRISHGPTTDEFVDSLLDTTQREIMTKAIKLELEG